MCVFARLGLLGHGQFFIDGTIIRLVIYSLPTFNFNPLQRERENKEGGETVRRWIAAG
jgi:hypothetical protein